MRPVERSRSLALMVLLLFAACATSKPKPLLPPFNTADQDVFGGWIEVAPVQPKAPRIAGELIAVEPERLVVLTPSGAVELEKKDVRTASILLYDPKTLLGNVTGGILLSLTNGVFAGITIPLWAVAGGIALHDVNVAAAIDYPQSGWEELRRGARFPQGLPEGLDIRKLAPRALPAAK